MSEPFRQLDLFGGKGEVLVWDLLRDAPAPPFREVLACELAIGASVGAHRQEHYPELVIVNAGSGQATVDGVVCPLSPGSVVYLPLGSVLELKCHGPQPLRYLIVKADGNPQ